MPRDLPGESRVFTLLEMSGTAVKMEFTGREFVISSEPSEWKTGALAPRKKGQTMRDRITIARCSWVGGRRNLMKSGQGSPMKTVSGFSSWLGGLAAVL